jgi:hypothetical protein
MMYRYMLTGYIDTDYAVNAFTTAEILIFNWEKDLLVSVCETARRRMPVFVIAATTCTRKATMSVNATRLGLRFNFRGVRRCSASTALSFTTDEIR